MYQQDADDHLLEAEDTKRLHMLRGMFLAQAAEVEDLLVTLDGMLYGTRKSRPLPAGAIVRRLSVEVVSESLTEQFGHLTWLFKRRNQLVHATLSVGYSYVQFTDSRDSVIQTLDPTRGGERVPWELAPKLDEHSSTELAAEDAPWGTHDLRQASSSSFESVSGHKDIDELDLESDMLESVSGHEDIDELDLESDMHRAYIALESAVAIFEILSQHRASAHG